MKSGILRLVGIVGSILFCALMLATYLSPEIIEKSAKGFIKAQIEKEVQDQYEAASASALADQALNLASRLGYEKDKLQKDLDNNLPQLVASAMAAMCGYDCEKKKMLAESITSSYLERIQNIGIAQSNLGNVIKGKYLQIVGKLKLDLRIFLGSNLVMFTLLLGLSFSKPRAVTHLFLPGMLLLLATVASSSIYIFGQDWFYTILYNDYMGFGYLVYIAVIFSFLLDVTFNKARVTTEIINAIASSIGSAFSVAPC